MLRMDVFLPDDQIMQLEDGILRILLHPSSHGKERLVALTTGGHIDNGVDGSDFLAVDIYDESLPPMPCEGDVGPCIRFNFL